MKKRILCLLLLLALLPAPLQARAAEPTAAERGLEAVMATGHGNLIVLPQEESWLAEWKTLYGRAAWYAPSLYVESVPAQQSGAPVMPNLFEGTEVTVVAEENDMSCILYEGVNHKRYAGWIPSIRLLEDFPGETHTIGEKPEQEPESAPGGGQHWSSEYMPGAETLYTVLDEPVPDCLGFTLEYQLIAENIGIRSFVLGPRTVWVKSGEEWRSVGSFPYPELGAVRVEVWLEEPMEIAAIATVADCHTPSVFDFRQSVKSFATA